MNDSLKNEIRQFGITTIKHLSFILGVPLADLIEVADHAGKYYSPFPKKNRPKPFTHRKVPGKFRTIDNPINPLKKIQKRIYERLLKPLKWPDHISGGIPGRSISTSARMHLGSPMVVTLDIKKYFPHITNLQIYDLWRGPLGCSPSVASMLTKLTTRDRRLPQGAPTSSALANLLLWSLDEPLRAFCSERGVSYGTWLDDLIFSGANSTDVINVAVKVLQNSGFSISHSKLRIMPSNNRQTITGLIVNSELGIPRSYISDVRAGIHNLSSGRVSDVEQNQYIRSL